MADRYLYWRQKVHESVGLYVVRSTEHVVHPAYGLEEPERTVVAGAALQAIVLVQYSVYIDHRLCFDCTFRPL